jgi:hypothetical protein
MSACVVATMAAWAIEQHPIDAVVTAGLREADHLAERYALAPAILQPLHQAADGDWGPYKPGAPLDAIANPGERPLCPARGHGRGDCHEMRSRIGGRH